MELKKYLITTYTVLVKIEKWDLEPTEGSIKKVVPEDYRDAVINAISNNI